MIDLPTAPGTVDPAPVSDVAARAPEPAEGGPDDTPPTTATSVGKAAPKRARRAPAEKAEKAEKKTAPTARKAPATTRKTTVAPEFTAPGRADQSSSGTPDTAVDAAGAAPRPVRARRSTKTAPAAKTSPTKRATTPAPTEPGPDAAADDQPKTRPAVRKRTGATAERPAELLVGPNVPGPDAGRPERTEHERAEHEPTAPEPAPPGPAEHQPTAPEPAERQPAASEPTAPEPTKHQPATSEPIEHQPTASEPIEHQPATSELIEHQPTASEPTASERPERGRSDHEPAGRHRSGTEVAGAPDAAGPRTPVVGWQAVGPRLRDHPGFAPELLALAAVDALGPRARSWVEQVRSAYPAADADGVARLATRRFVLMAGTGGALAAGAGVFAPVAELAAVLWTQANLVLHVAAAYGRDPAHPDRAAELLVLTSVHPDDGAARAALAAARAADVPADGPWGRTAEAAWRLAMPVAAQAGGWLGLRLAARLLPGAAVLAAAIGGTAAAERVAARAVARYRRAGQSQSNQDRGSSA
ncbi:hypothetical protein [Micromonospora sp. NPDC051141]|uniref:hypothetical protein n=1 Tax=Micromonospora sp. NPDC051141 TaxID=3364284 RepID=UPI00379D6F83